MDIAILHARGDAHGDVVSSWFGSSVVVRLAVGAKRSPLSVGGLPLVLVWSRASAAAGWPAFEALLDREASLFVVQIGETPIPPELGARGAIVEWGHSVKSRLMNAVRVADAPPTRKATRPSMARLALGLLAALGFASHAAAPAAASTAPVVRPNGEPGRLYALQDAEVKQAHLSETIQMDAASEGWVQTAIDLDEEPTPFASDAEIVSLGQPAYLQPQTWSGGSGRVQLLPGFGF